MISNYYLFVCLLFASLVLGQHYKKYPDPKIFEPNNATVWQAGQLETISWNSSYTLPNDLYYNDRTRVSIQLYRFNKKTPELLFTIADSFPFVYGKIMWKVPNITVLEGEKFNEYFVIVYPTFFDWPKACPGCKNNVYRSSLFSISPCFNDIAPFCNGNNTFVTYLTPPEEEYQQYWPLLRNIAIGISCAFILAFVLAYFVYSKQGKKTWALYKRRRIGELYKYQPPSQRSGDSPTSLGNGAVSPLSTFLSGQQPNNFVTNDTTSNVNYDRKLESLFEQDEDEEAEEKDISLCVIKNDGEDASDNNGALNNKELEIQAPKPVVKLNSALVDSNEAKALSNAFRHALRTAADEDNYKGASSFSSSPILNGFHLVE